jgi:hypothetical protein
MTTHSSTQLQFTAETIELLLSEDSEQRAERARILDSASNRTAFQIVVYSNSEDEGVQALAHANRLKSLLESKNAASVSVRDAGKWIGEENG